MPDAHKVYIDIVEEWPVFVLVKKSASTSLAIVSDRKLKEWKAAIAAFKQAQAEMKKLVDPSALEIKKGDRA